MTAHIEIFVDDLTAETRGAQPQFGYEYRIKVQDASLLQGAMDFLRFVIEYADRENKRIEVGETFVYGYWLTRFERTTSGVLEVWEYNDDATAFVEGGSRALTYWRDQNAICKKYGVAFSPPRADKMAAVCAGVYDGETVEGVRYPSPEHMSGWWMTTDRYNGDVNSLNVVHLYHVTAARPEIARYLAMPPGWYFLSSGEVWFDKDVANARP